MSNIDKDGDVNMDKENIAESNIIAHTERVGREIVKKTDALFGELKVSSSADFCCELRSPYQERSQ